ncbi:hypothetical protein [Methylibium petroleiphilum]
MSERERFEAAVRAASKKRVWHFDLERIEADPDDTPEEAERVGEYAYYDTQAAWLLWQAARSGQAASGPSQGARSDERTGWPPGLLQDDSRELSRALASKPDAMVHARDAVAKIGQPEAPTAARMERDALAEQLACVRQALPEEWRSSEPSVAVATLAAELVLLRKLAHPPARSGAGSEEGQG